MAQLILEEALETVKALGFAPRIDPDHQELVLARQASLTMNTIVLEPFVCMPGQTIMLHKPITPDLEQVIDGCCDTIYVCTGALLKCGVPDVPHLEEVCRANDAKFPGGVVTMHPTTGKYLKPEGWLAPSHKAVQDFIVGNLDMKKMQELVVQEQSK